MSDTANNEFDEDVEERKRSIRGVLCDHPDCVTSKVYALAEVAAEQCRDAGEDGAKIFSDILQEVEYTYFLKGKVTIH